MKGWGLTIQGDYVGGWDGKFWGPSPVGLTAQGEPLVAGLSAGTDGNIIPYGRNFTIPTFPSPWNTKTFTAIDVGMGLVGKQIYVFAGAGSNGAKEAARISEMQTNTVCVCQSPSSYQQRIQHVTNLTHTSSMPATIMV
jgi:3D (Asp-Asp-Asp) domain-containing protein